jgi:N-acetylglutamate synthase-like GNAT family acetyltransferase
MITIQLLKDDHKPIAELANIWYDVLGKIWMPNLSLAYIEQLIGEWKDHTDKLPLAHVAMHHTKPIGIASLQEHCGIKPALTPWLSSLVVDRNYQKQGIGKQLIAITKKKAQSLGFRQCYLFTFDPTLPSYYNRLGWITIGEDSFAGHPVTVMEVKL